MFFKYIALFMSNVGKVLSLNAVKNSGLRCFLIIIINKQKK